LAAPPVAALCYPFLLRIFHGAVTPPEQTKLLAAVALLLAISVPAIGIYVCARLSGLKRLTLAELRLKRIALLSLGAAPLYTTTGVVLYAANSTASDFYVWIALWFPISALAAHSALADSTPAPEPKAAALGRLRYAHGTSAALILLAFLAMHLTNHLMGLWSVAAHRHLMDMFRLVYRARFVEPLVIGLFLFQVASGAVLLWSYVGRPTDFFRTLQIATGAYLFFYVLGHMNSVLVARAITKVQTDWDWAIGAPAGLIHGAWSIRLLPHYLTGVFFVLTHVVLGGRVIALAHHMPPERADLLAKTGIAIAAVVAVAIIVGMSGFHLAN
jgi:hypothetical protein